MSSRRSDNNFILREIQDDMVKIKRDISKIQLDLKVILAKVTENTKQEKQEQAKKEADSWWFASVGR